jgi:Flp pilus assembly protein TadG
MIKKLLRSEKGASVVEFALLAPVMIFLLVGLIEIGRFTFFAILAANAARTGALYGAQTLHTADDGPGMTQYAENDGQNFIQWKTPIATALCSVSGGAPAPCVPSSGGGPPTNTIYYVQVQVTGQYSTIFNYPGIPNPVTVTGNSLQRVIAQ